MGRKKLSCNGFWMYSRFLKRHLESLGAEFPGGVPQAMEVAHTEWTKLPLEERQAWKRHAKAYKKTDEFKKLQKKYKRLHANSPSRRRGKEGGRRGSDSDVDSDGWVEVVEGSGGSEDDEGVDMAGGEDHGDIGPALDKLFQGISINKVTFAFDSIATKDTAESKSTSVQEIEDHIEKTKEVRSPSPTNSDYFSLEIPPVEIRNQISTESAENADGSHTDSKQGCLFDEKSVESHPKSSPIDSPMVSQAPVPVKMSYASAVKRK